MVSRSRRHRGKRFQRGEYFAVLPDEVLRDAPFRTLPHFARSLLAAMAAQYRGTNNGDISMTAKTAAEYGITSCELAAGTRLLEETGLILRTRQGRFAGGKSLCNLWALTCLPIDPSDKYDMPRAVQLPAPNTWAQWKQPDDWRQFIRRTIHKAKGRKSPSPQREEQAAPHEGNGTREIYSPRGDQGSGNSAPHAGDTSYDLGQGLSSRVRQLIELHPHMGDVDVAVAFNWKVNQLDVARIRQALQPRSSGAGSDAIGR